MLAAWNNYAVPPTAGPPARAGAARDDTDWAAYDARLEQLSAHPALPRAPALIVACGKYLSAHPGTTLEDASAIACDVPPCAAPAAAAVLLQRVSSYQSQASTVPLATPVDGQADAHFFGGNYQASSSSSSDEEEE